MNIRSDDDDGPIIVIKLTPDTSIKHVQSVIGQASNERQMVVFQVAKDAENMDGFFVTIGKEAVDQDVKVMIERESDPGSSSEQ
jgi:hypothetical protein